MEKKSFEQLYRMLNLINHKQVNKVNIKEAITKADRSGVLLNEDNNSLDLDFIMSDEKMQKETDTIIKSVGSKPFYANDMSAQVKGTVNFDMPYRMWLLRFHSRTIQIKVNEYNNNVDDEHKIYFDFDDSSNDWIQKKRESGIGLGTIGIQKNMTDLGRFILEFMSRVYTGKINNAERNFEKFAGKIFTTTEAQHMSNSFIRVWLDTVAFDVAKKSVKALFKNEVNERTIIGAKNAAIDYIMLVLKNKYDPTKANFFAWSVEVMKNIIKNFFRKMGNQNVEDTNQIVSFLDSLEYPYTIYTSAWFDGRIEKIEQSIGHNMTNKDWVKVRQQSNGHYSNVTKSGDGYAFKYNSSNALLNDIMAANEISLGEEVRSLSPLYVINIGQKSSAIKNAIFKSDLRPSGEGKHKDKVRIKVSYNVGKIKKHAVIIFSKSAFDSNSENPEKAFVEFQPKKDAADFIKIMKNQKWAPFLDAYEKKQEAEDALLRSQGLSTVTDEEGIESEETENFTIDISGHANSLIRGFNNAYKEANKENNEPLKEKLLEKITETEKVLEGNTVLTVYYIKEITNGRTSSSVTLNSIIDENGDDVVLTDELKNYLKEKAEEASKGSGSNREKEKVNFDSEEMKDFDSLNDDEKEQRFEQLKTKFKSMAGTQDFVNKFIDTILKSEGGDETATNFEIATTNKIKNLKMEEDKTTIKEFYSFLGQMIADSILTGANVANTSDIYSRLRQDSIKNLSTKLSPEKLSSVEKYFTLSPDNLKRVVAAVNAFKNSKTRTGKQLLSKMGLAEAKRIMAELLKNKLIETFVTEIGTEHDIELDEERISNEDGATKVNDKENFIGSQVFGEDIGDVGKETDWNDGMYGVFSYGEQFPIYVYTNMPFHDQDGNLKNKDGKFRWFHNVEQYKFDINGDGEKEVMSSVEKHKELLKPNSQTHGLTRATLASMINAFKKKHSIKELSHVSIEPGGGLHIHYGGKKED